MIYYIRNMPTYHTKLHYPIIQLEPPNTHRKRKSLEKIERSWKIGVKLVVLCPSDVPGGVQKEPFIMFCYTWVYIMCEHLGQRTGKMAVYYV